MPGGQVHIQRQRIKIVVDIFRGRGDLLDPMTIVTLVGAKGDMNVNGLRQFRGVLVLGEERLRVRFGVHRDRRIGNYRHEAIFRKQKPLIDQLLVVQLGHFRTSKFKPFFAT